MLLCPKCGKEYHTAFYNTQSEMVGCNNCLPSIKADGEHTKKYRVIDRELFEITNGSIDVKIMEGKMLKLEEENIKLKRKIYNLEVANEKLHDELVKAVGLTNEDIQASLDKTALEVLGLDMQGELYKRRPFCSMSEEEVKNFKPISKEEIQTALAKGKEERDAIERAAGVWKYRSRSSV